MFWAFCGLICVFFSGFYSGISNYMLYNTQSLPSVSTKNLVGYMMIERGGASVDCGQEGEWSIL